MPKTEEQIKRHADNMKYCSEFGGYFGCYPENATCERAEECKRAAYEILSSTIRSAHRFEITRPKRGDQLNARITMPKR